MLFNSYQFLLVFLPVALLLYRFADRFPGARVPSLLGLSLVFYGYWDWRFLALIVPSILINWFAASLFLATKRTAFIFAAITVDLAVLALFKYSAFVLDNIYGATDRQLWTLELALPLGISFFTFHHIMYLVDLRRGIAPPVSLSKYALYIAFFPQVLAGPLVRWSEVMPQFGGSAFAPGWERRWSSGITFIIIGLAEKVLLGDALALVTVPIFAQAESGQLVAGQSWAALVGFSFQIFFDFCGYTDIAIGTALLFGIQLPPNFDGPYRATSLRDFWRRWHMTLSRFLRDYLYIPLGGNRRGLPRQAAALLVTFALGGLWHGAGWNFVIWGLLHGTGLTAGVLWRRFLGPMPALLGWLLTYGYVVLAWAFFRSSSFSGAVQLIEGLSGWPPHNGLRTVATAAFCAIVLPPSHAIVARATRSGNRVVAALLAVALVLVMLKMRDAGSYEFIYFRF